MDRNVGDNLFYYQFFIIAATTFLTPFERKKKIKSCDKLLQHYPYLILASIELFKKNHEKEGVSSC